MSGSSREKLPRVVIVGGGLAGLSAAEALARSAGPRFDITLLEARRMVGGRAGSFSDPSSGETVDYCQHVAMGCCTNLIQLLERCGLDERLRRYSELRFLHPHFPPSRFAASKLLPAPLHLASALSSLAFLHGGQRRQIRRGLWRLLRTPADALEGQTAIDWLREQDQSDETIQDFWSVVLVSALGEEIDLVSMPAVRKVFVDGFAAARGASDVLVPSMPLSELFGRRLCDEIRDLGVDIQTGRTVQRLIRTDDSSVSVATANGHYDADHIIVAVPWYAVADVVGSDLLPDVAQFARIPASPITGMHLWFDREITDVPHAVMVGTQAQWLFRQPWDRPSTDGSGHYYQVVISASGHSKSIPKEDLVAQVLAELQHAFPGAGKASLLHYRIVTDPQSVFSIRPEVDALRPPARTALPWLHLAGDWIASGWPSTMEGAVISGRMSASSVLKSEGSPGVKIDPGLPPGWLARRMIRT